MSKLPMCPYGARCYRSNPQHKLEFRHDVPNCPFGKACYRQNPCHLKDFRHEPVAVAEEKVSKRRRTDDELGSPKPTKRNQELDFFASSSKPHHFQTGANDVEASEESDENCDGKFDSDGEYVFIPTGKSHAELTAELLRGDCRYPAYTVHFDQCFALDQVFPLLSYQELVAMSLVSSNWFRFVHRGASELWKCLYERNWASCQCRRRALCAGRRAFFSSSHRLWTCGKIEKVQDDLNCPLSGFRVHHPLEEEGDWRKRFVWRSCMERVQNHLARLGARATVFHMNYDHNLGHDLGVLQQCWEGWLKKGVAIKEANLEVLLEDVQRATAEDCQDLTGAGLSDLQPLFQFRADFSRSVGYVGFSAVRGALLALILHPQPDK